MVVFDAVVETTSWRRGALRWECVSSSSSTSQGFGEGDCKYCGRLYESDMIYEVSLCTVAEPSYILQTVLVQTVLYNMKCANRIQY